MTVVFIGQQAGQIAVLLLSKVRAKKTPQAEARGVLTVTVMLTQRPASQKEGPGSSPS